MSIHSMVFFSLILQQSGSSKRYWKVMRLNMSGRMLPTSTAVTTQPPCHLGLRRPSGYGSQEGDWMMVGFSPRKAAISLYIYSGTSKQEELLPRLGKFKLGKGCIYVKKLADIDTDVLKRIILLNIEDLEQTYGNHSSFATL